MTLKVCVLAAAAVAAWSLKRHYAGAAADDLAWILHPTATLVGVMTATPFEVQPGEGYFSRERMFLIEKSCAGINFMLAAFGMLTLARLPRVASASSALAVLIGSMSTAYAGAVLVNAVRIALAMWLAAHPAMLSAFSATAVHRIEGIAVYFGGLVVLYELIDHVDRRVHWRVALPLASYYGVTIAIPLLNGAAAMDGFAMHAAMVLVVPLVAITIWCAAGAAADGLRSSLARNGTLQLSSTCVAGRCRVRGKD